MQQTSQYPNILNPGPRTEQFRFHSLATELRYSILSFLDKDRDRLSFAKCSKDFYFFIFPLRFRERGVRVYKDESYGWLELFDDGGWMAPVRHYIRSATLEAKNIGDILPLPASLLRFPNITRLAVSISNTGTFERNIYAAIFPLLEVSIPFYHNITYFALWLSGQEFDLNALNMFGRGTPIDMFRKPRKKLVLREGTDTESGDFKLYEYRLLTLPEEEQEFLGYYISPEQFLDMLVAGEIPFPKKLRTFDIFTVKQEDYWDPLFLFPLVLNKGIDTLCLEDITDTDLIIQTPRQSYCFENIKTLQLNRVTETNRRLSDLLKIHFPNLDSLKLTIGDTFPKPKISWVKKAIPKKIPNIKNLEIVWMEPGPDYYKSFRFVTEDLERRLNRGSLKLLRTMKISTVFNRPFGMGLVEKEAMCRISRVGEDEGPGSGRWVFDCTGDLDYGNKLDYYSDGDSDEASECDSDFRGRWRGSDIGGSDRGSFNSEDDSTGSETDDGTDDGSGSL
ncbi:hypothetical protein TWF506_008475 [Arthrobotrys conoides]|uniref:Uncharacterized protein n=1 Tax=Arthrobotrys conoides TaxID=74498 RepID=A0AAN8NDA8_9PEZI